MVRSLAAAELSGARVDEFLAWQRAEGRGGRLLVSSSREKSRPARLLVVRGVRLRPPAPDARIVSTASTLLGLRTTGLPR
jgi:hypothetical protein